MSLIIPGKPYQIGIIIKNFQLKKLNCACFACVKMRCLTREEALLNIWHDDNYFNGRSMDVFLSKIRKYLKDDQNVEIINVHGRGYKLLIN
jgi:DNA-binding response OmpR family regulator